MVSIHEMERGGPSNNPNFDARTSELLARLLGNNPPVTPAPEVTPEIERNKEAETPVKETPEQEHPNVIPTTVTTIVRSFPDIKNLKLVRRPELHVVGVMNSTDIQADNEWLDSYLISKAGINLRRLNEADAVKYCDMFVKDMTVGVSERTAGVLIVLAWQLRSIVRGKLVFPEDDPAKIITAVEVETLSDTAIMTVTGAPYVRPTTVSNETYIQAVCFIAASMLRLLSKTPDNYRKAYDRHIREAYYKFYKGPFPIQGFDPSDQCIQAIHSLFSNLNVYRNAIGSFLYYHCELTNDKGMCQMLYEQHLGLTGMHAVNLFTRACVALQASAEDLGSALRHRQNKNALETLSHIFYKYVVNEKGEATIARKTWKYARLYDAKYFMAIQTKNCKALVCILAYLCSYAGVQGKQDIMNIVHIKALPAETKERYNKWASRIYAYFDVGETAADGNPFALE